MTAVNALAALGIKSTAWAGCVVVLWTLLACKPVEVSPSIAAQPAGKTADINARPTAQALEPVAKIDLASDSAEKSLASNVGQRVTLVGLWGGPGKESGYIYGREHQAHVPEVYVMATREEGLARQTALENSGKDGSAVQVTGTLRFEAGAVAGVAGVTGGAGGVTSQPAGPSYYVDVEEATVVFAP